MFINLITDSLPALAISMEPSNPALIHDKPRSRDESVLNRPTMTAILAYGTLIAVAAVTAFLIGLGKVPFVSNMLPEVAYGPVCASTMAFATTCLARLWHGFNMRGKEGIFKLKIQSNWWVVGAFVLGAILLHAILRLSIFSAAFGTSLLSVHLLGIMWLLSFLPTLIIQIYKAVRY